MKTLSKLCVVLSFAVIGIIPFGVRAQKDDRSFLVGVVGPLSTSSKSFGTGHLQGVTLAIDQHNMTGKYKVDIRIVDDQSNPALGIAAVKELEKEGAVAILGPCNSSVARAVLAEGKIGVPLLSAMTTASELTETFKDPFFFRMNVSDKKRIAGLFEALFNSGSDVDDLRPQRLLVFYEKNDAYGEGLVSNAEAWLKINEPNFLVSNFQKVPYSRDLSFEDAENLVEGLRESLGKKSDSILMLGLADDALTFVSAIRKLGLPSKVYLPEPEHNIFRVAAKEGTNIAGVRVFSVWDPSDTSLNAFVPNFKRKFSEEPTFAATLAYDAANILLWALDESVAGAPALPALRAKIAANLKTFDPSKLKLALNGDQHLASGEYADLRFRGLQFDQTGKLIGWNLPLPAPTLTVRASNSPVELPKLYVFGVVMLFGFIGSSMRELYNQRVTEVRQLLHAVARARVLVVDPLIALLVFTATFLGVMALKPNLISASPQTSTIYLFAAFVLGLLSGYMGIGVIYALLAKLGVEKPKDAVNVA